MLDATRTTPTQQTITKGGFNPSDADSGKGLLDLLFSAHAKASGIAGPLIEFRYLKEDGEPIRDFSPFSKLTSYIEEGTPAKRNQEGYNVYFGINPRSALGTGTQDSIRDIVCFWADVDVKGAEPSEKEKVKARIDSFPLEPSAIVDSGHGYHLYWVLKDPVIDRSPEVSLLAKQILRGLVGRLGADPQATDFSRILRLPGTKNLKDPTSPMECTLLRLNKDRLYTLADFEPYRDVLPDSSREEAQLSDIPTKRLLVRFDSLENASMDVGALEVTPYIKRMILIGDPSLKPIGDKSRSGLDQTILTALVRAGYDLETTSSIFMNEHLGCSKRMRQRGIGQLKFEYGKARKFLESHRSDSPQRQQILTIKTSPQSGPEKAREIREYIKRDLFGNDGPADSGFKEGASYFYFDRAQKLLLEVRGEDFKWFLRSRYGLDERDLKEVIEDIKTTIWKHGKETRIYTFSFFDTTAKVLYISTNKNQVIRIDGDKIELVDNGTDGVLFKSQQDWAPLHISTKNVSGSAYFHEGFSWDAFEKSDSLLYRHLISKANFADDGGFLQAPDPQKYLLILYFYSLFFESVLMDKPILCFEGVKASGKSYIGTAIGTILFGENFQPTNMPEQQRDLGVALSQNNFLVLDNVDSRIPGSHLNMLCQAATGGVISLRQLYTDNTEIKSRLRVFVAITTRHPKFKRDDFVDRLIIFNTEKIKNPIGRSILFRELLSDRDGLWAEILLNLNCIVRLLKAKDDWKPRSSLRIADWDLFCKKVHSEEGLRTYSEIVDIVTARKDRFSLKDDPFYEILKELVYERGQNQVNLSAKELYDSLREGAVVIGLEHSFTGVYKSPLALAHRISHVIDELGSEFDIVVTEQSHGKTKRYSFSKKTPPSHLIDAGAATVTAGIREGVYRADLEETPPDGSPALDPDGELAGAEAEVPLLKDSYPHGIQKSALEA